MGTDNEINSVPLISIHYIETFVSEHFVQACRIPVTACFYCIGKQFREKMVEVVREFT